MAECSDIDKVLKRNGTDQLERFIEQLDPENFQLIDFEVEDWILFAHNFAQYVNYYSIDNAHDPSGDWQDFFDYFKIKSTPTLDRNHRNYKVLKEKVSNALQQFEEESNLTPHLTLFVCFLKLLNFSKQRLNNLTKRHLDFFYKEILQIEKLPATKDKVHVVFELAKRVTEEHIAKGTLLDGGKDANKKKIIYKTTEDFVPNKAKIGALKTIYNDPNLGELKYSDVANTLDGVKEKLPEDANFWLPFGYTSQAKKFTELQDALVGFAIASPMLQLNEGLRSVSVTISFNENLNLKPPFFSQQDLLDVVTIKYSGEESWSEDFKLSNSIIPLNKAVSGVFGTELKLVFQIPKEFPAITSYNSEVLEGGFTTQLPMVRFLINTDKFKGHRLYQSLQGKSVSKIKISVDVKEMVNLTLDSDTGVLNNKKPFYPFTTQPVKGASFKINNAEVFSKKWKNISLDIRWKNTPDSFVQHYKAYKKSYLQQNSKTLFEEAMFVEKQKEKQANQPDDIIDIASNDEKIRLILNEDPETLIVKNDNYFKAVLSVLYKEDWKTSKGNDANKILFQRVGQTLAYKSLVSINNTTNFEIGKSGPIRLTLKQSFLHSLFPRIYTLALTAENPDTLIPNDPYTPLAESIKLNYSAEEEVDFTLKSKEAYDKNRIVLFHEDVFGTYNEHSYLKEQAKANAVFNSTKSVACNLVATHNYGTLYIGLEEAKNEQHISLLIQVLEGSENPKVPSFASDEKVAWSILCDNQWKNLGDDLLIDQVDNFLKSGIVKINIPKQATINNTRLPKGFIWIKAQMNKAYDAVCKVIDIKSQVVLATFQNDENELSHLDKGLPAQTISKLINRIPQVKSITQPFNSFGGKNEESDALYYRRVSERLRHKNRAITLWDYEHLVMQKFPEVFKVKCLNHTTETSFTVAGEVLLVVVPDIINKNVFDIYEPRLSKANLNKIQNYINQLNSLQVTAKVINPVYESVAVSLNVKFYDKYDSNFYKKQLEKDISKFLSPWAYDNTKEIKFGTSLNRSIIIDYIEKLEYVDYLVELEMAKHPEGLEVPEGITDEAYKLLLKFGYNVEPSSPKHILVSAKKHFVSTQVTTCKTFNIE